MENRVCARNTGEEWHPLFVEALQKQTYTEYLLDTLLGGTAEEKAGIIKEHGKEVMRIGERISGLAASHKAGCHERSGLAPTGTDGRLGKGDPFHDTKGADSEHDWELQDGIPV